MRRVPSTVRIPVIALALFVSYCVCAQAGAPPTPTPTPLVQSAFAGSANGQTTVTATFSQPPTAGNFLVAIVSVKPGDSITSVDSGVGLPWGAVINQAGTTTPRRPGQAIFYAFASPSLQTVTATTTPSTIGLQIFEYSAGGPVTILVGTNNGPGSAPATVSINFVGDSNDLLVAGITMDTSDSVTGVTNGFTEEFDFVAGSSGGRLTSASADRVGASNSSTTFSHGNNIWRAQLVMFRFQ